MSKISEILKTLCKEDYDALMLAFQAQTTYIINLDQETFIGVNVQLNNTLQMITQEGVWMHGRRILKII